MRKIYQTSNGLQEILEGQDFLIQDDWVKLTEAEVEAVINPSKTEEQIRQEFKTYRQLALDTSRIEIEIPIGTVIYNSDMTINRTTTELENIGFQTNERSRLRIKEFRDDLFELLPSEDTIRNISWILYDNTIITNPNFRIMDEAYKKARDLLAQIWLKTTKEELYAIISTDTEWKEKFDSLSGGQL